MLIRNVSQGKVSFRKRSTKFPVKSWRFLACMLVIHVMAAGMASMAQGSGPSPRITAAVDESRLTKLSGNVPMLARAQYDQGEASPSTQMTHIRLVLSRSAAQQAALDTYLAELQQKSSPNYHKWLTPEQFGKLYGPADSDVAVIVSWLESHGLKLEQISSGRTNIAFSGTVSQVEEAFHTKIHSFQTGDRQFYSNVSDPSIPAALAPVVKGVAQLDTIRPRPHHISSPAGMIDRDTKRLVPVNAAKARGPRPNLTVGSGTSSDPYFLYIVPGDAATIYDTPNTTFNANYTSGTSYTGSGVTIGIGGDATIQASTVEAYRSSFLGNSTAPTITNVDGVTSTDDTDEAYIDTELSGGLAPGAAIHFYTSTDLTSAIEQALSDNTVDIFSLSFGECELGLTTSENEEIAAWWQQAAGQGITVSVSTGDDGSAGCDATTDSNGNNITAAQYGLQVSGFASTPYNIAVGGTDLYGLNSSFSTYASTSQGSSATYYRTALSYIPESTWNDSTQADTTISANVPWSAASGDANIVGGNGGASSCSTNTDTSTATGTCTSGYTKPTWQRGTTIPSDSVRDLPDVSFMSGNGFDPATWLVCTDDTEEGSTGATVTEDCEEQSDGYFYFAGFGGTSTAAPAFAGMLALVEQKEGSRLGQAATQLYDLYNGSYASSIFHDVTVGNNSVPCTSGTTDCSENTAGYYYETGYNTGTGFDLATGMGSIDVKELLTHWGTGTDGSTPTITITPSATSITNSTALTVVVAVTGSSSTPTGTITLSGGGYTSSEETLSSGSYTFTVAAGDLSSGTDTLTVGYSGDTNYASATATTSITVTAPAVSLSPTSLTFASTAVGSSAATQTITLTNSGTAALTVSGVSIAGTNASSFSETNTCSSVAVSGTCTITVTFTPTASGSLTASVSIADNATNTPQTVSLTGTGVVESYSLSATAVTISSAGSTGTSTVTATATGGYTGTITLTCSVAAISGGTDTPSCAGSTITVASGSTTATGTVTLNTTAASSSAKRARIKAAGIFAQGWIGVGCALLACIAFFGIPARRRAWRSLLSLLLFAAAFGALIGCGSSSSSTTTTSTGTTAGSYTVTITGTDTNSVTKTTTFTVTVD
jgi:subtilase family serine protease